VSSKGIIVGSSLKGRNTRPAAPQFYVRVSLACGEVYEFMFARVDQSVRSYMREHGVADGKWSAELITHAERRDELIKRGVTTTLLPALVSA
jgi:hypothetical protein